jgi:hypothetical protein
MKKLLALVLSVFFLNATAQNYEVKGKLLDESTNEIIPLANTFLDSAFITTTNISGHYTFKASKGSHSLMFTAFRFEDSTQNISVQKNTDLNISLKVSDQRIDQVVISASRMKQKISDVTVSMDVIRADLIENNNTTSLEKLICLSASLPKRIPSVINSLSKQHLKFLRFFL